MKNWDLGSDSGVEGFEGLRVSGPGLKGFGFWV